MRRLTAVMTISMFLAGPIRAEGTDHPSDTAKGAATQPMETSTRPAPYFKTEKEQFSYAIGYHVANGMKRQGIDLDLDVLLAGIRDTLAGGEMKMTQAEIQQATQKLQERQMAKMREEQGKQQAERKAQAEKNKEAGEAFLAENRNKPGVHTLPSGLQYKVIKSGDPSGPHPTDTDRVKVNYKGTLIDGTEFDSSIPGEPRIFGVKGVIPGWTEALKLMRPGDRWEVYIPPHLAYGESGRGRKIGGNATLIFDMELVGIEPIPSASATTKPANDQ